MTADERYAANLTILANNPSTVGMLPQLQQFPLTNVQLIPTPSGHIYGHAWDVATQQYIPLVDPNDPCGQGKRDAEALYTRNAKVFCLIGLGLGYFATELAKLLQPYQRLCIWDLDAGMYKAMLYCCDIAPLFSERRIDIVVGNDIINQVEPWWLQLEAGEKLHIIPPMRAGYTHIYMKQQYDTLLEKTVEMLRYHMVGMATWRMFGRHIGDNDLRNAPEYFSSPGYEHLKDLWKDRPAVCIAAGPSLQKNLCHLLPHHQREKVAIIAAGTVYAFLHGLGLEPDAVTTIDFQRLNWTDQFANVPLDANCPLVYLHSTYPQTPRRWPGPRFVAENASDTTGWLHKYSEGKKSAAQVQTVAHLNLLVALEFGANPIILVGQDLSMPLDAHHAVGARAQDQSPNETDPSAFILTTDFTGKPIHTRHSFLSMKTVFERIIAENSDRTFVNCSEAGLALVGAANVPLKTILDTFDIPTKGMECSRLLRPSIRRAWEGYIPQTKETLTQDFDVICQHVNTLAQFGRDVQRLWQDACNTPISLTEHEEQVITSEEIDLPWDVARMLFAQRYYTPILAQERILQERPIAFGLFAIRHFALIELYGEIPPRMEDLPTDIHKAHFNCERLYRVACMISEEVPSLQRALQETRRRLDNSAPMSIEHAIALQRYDYAADKLYDEDNDKFDIGRLQAQLYEHTQQYEAALALYEQYDLAPAHVKRIHQRLTRWRADVREAMAPYFQKLGNGLTTMPASRNTTENDWLID